MNQLAKDEHIASICYTLAKNTVHMIHDIAEKVMLSTI